MSNNLLKLKIEQAVTIALISAGVFSPSHAQVSNIDVNNPIGTTIPGLVYNDNSNYTVSNAGTISDETTSSDAHGIYLSSSSSITNLTNSGTISGETTTSGNAHGIYLSSNSSITNLTNSGTISGETTTSTSGNAFGINLTSNSSITNLTNSGTISGETTSSDTYYAYGIYLRSSSSITNLTNSGTISGETTSGNAFGINLTSNSSITNLTNSGTISGKSTSSDTYYAFGIYLRSSASITYLTNSGTISGETTSGNAFGIYLDDSSSITYLTNSGTISGETTTSGNAYGIYLSSSSSITNLTNSGTISGETTSGNAYGIHLTSDSSITYLTNSGTISGKSTSGDAYVIHLHDSSSITYLTNSGTISGETTSGNAYGIHLDDSSSITNLTNSGTISGKSTSGNAYGIYLSSSSSITNLTNSGTISGKTKDLFVSGSGNIYTFNNLQQNLTYEGKLPLYYNIIIKNKNNYGQLNVSNPIINSSGPTQFNLFPGNVSIGVAIPAGIYQNVMTGELTGFISSTSGELTGDGTDSVGTAEWNLEETAGNLFDLIVTGSYAYIGHANTQLALNQTAKNIGSVFQNMEASGKFAHMTTYDCNLFGKQDYCVSLGGRITNSEGKDQAGTLIIGKKVNDNLRLGAFLDNSISQKGYKDINLTNNIPLLGVMAVWNQNKNYEGLQLKAGNTYQSKDAEITRASVITSELAKGDTEIDTKSYIVEASYNYKMDTNVSLQPFVALRYMKTEMDGYTEKDASAPVTYQKMDQDSFTALTGLKAQYQFSPKFSINGSLGLEHDISDNEAKLQGSISGISPFNASAISSDINKNRLIASVGADMIVFDNNRVGVKGAYQELKYKNEDATTFFVTYTLPF